MVAIKRYKISFLISVVMLLLYYSHIFLFFFNLPKFYGGNPNFNVEKYKEEVVDKKYLDRGYVVGQQSIVLPPKTIDVRLINTTSLLQRIGLLWGVFWSIYSFIKRKTFYGKEIIWIMFGVCVLPLIIGLLIFRPISH